MQKFLDGYAAPAFVQRHPWLPDGWVGRAGFVEVRQDTILIERWVPLKPIEREILTDLLCYRAEQAADGGIPEEDQVFWSRFKDPESPVTPVNDPELYWCEANARGAGPVPI